MRSIALLVVLAAACAPRATATPSPIRHHAASIAWKDAPPNLPAGAKTAVLEGDPRGAGLFTMRLSVPAGYELPLHTHDGDERITVLSGKACVTIEKQEECFETGDYYVTPPKTPHTVRFPEATILQATGLGPWTYTPAR